MMRVTRLIGDRQAAKHDLRRCYTRDGYVSLTSGREGRIGRKSRKRKLWEGPGMMRVLWKKLCLLIRLGLCLFC